MILLRLTSGYFCAGVEIDINTGCVIRRAPILRKSILLGWTLDQVMSFAMKRSWKVEIVE